MAAIPKKPKSLVVSTSGRISRAKSSRAGPLDRVRGARPDGPIDLVEALALGVLAQWWTVLGLRTVGFPRGS
jgi:hypothetical protein